MSQDKFEIFLASDHIQNEFTAAVVIIDKYSEVYGRMFAAVEREGYYEVKGFKPFSRNQVFVIARKGEDGVLSIYENRIGDVKVFRDNKSINLSAGLRQVCFNFAKIKDLSL